MTSPDTASSLAPEATSPTASFTHGAQLDPNNALMWFDAETTSLDPDTGHLLEIAVEFTDFALEKIGGGFSCYVRQPEEVLQGASDWTKEHVAHAVEGSRSHERAVGCYDELDALLVTWMDQLGLTKPGPYLAGNTVWFDRAFIKKRLPKTYARLNYRQLDVSSLMLFVQSSLTPALKKALTVDKKRVHAARNDLLESQFEYRVYRNFITKVALAVGHPENFDAIGKQP